MDDRAWWRSDFLFSRVGVAIKVCIGYGYRLRAGCENLYMCG